MSIVVNGRSVPVVWEPSDLSGPDSDGHVGRQVAIQAAVHHRVVGTLESMTNVTFEPTADGRLLPGERRVSSNFGIGFWGTELRIVQYVALENTAFCNGQTDKDVAALLGNRPWAIYTAVRKKAGHHVSANEFTYSIEHEDNAQLPSTDPRRGIVREEIIEASIALDRLLLSGDGPAIRKAGIKCNDTAASQLAKIVPGPTTIVDHNVAAPISKPFCWRRWANDPGFPQARYLAALTEEEPMPQSFRYRPDTKIGTWTVDGEGHFYIPLATPTKWGGPINPATFGTHQAIGPVDLVPPIPTSKPTTADRTTGVVIGLAAAAMLWSDGKFVAVMADVPAPDPAVTKAAVNAALDHVATPLAAAQTALKEARPA